MGQTIKYNFFAQRKGSKNPMITNRVTCFIGKEKNLLRSL